MEIELQPAGRLRDESGTTLVAPATVINYGLTDDWEVVFEGQGQTPLSPSGPTSLTTAGAFLKHVIVPGSLQDKSGPSVATEFGVLLPDSTGSSGVGASLAGIVSQRWGWGTIHLYAETALTRDHHGDLFLSAIVEGPPTWTVRPVAEIFYENEFGKEHTAGRADLQSSGRSQLRRRDTSRTHDRTAGERDSRRPDFRLSALF
jgi:hypothetical protein